MICKICGVLSKSTLCCKISCKARAKECICEICKKKVPLKYKRWHVCSDKCLKKWNRQNTIGYNNAFLSEFKIYNMNTRPVFIRNFSSTYDNNIKECSDCGRQTKVVVYELNGTKWGWCGQCSVGG